MANKIGFCHICGKFGKLSFEHVPPESAFNDKPIIKAKLDEILSQDKLSDNPFSDISRGEISQRGMGDYTLCERCNNITGHWYTPAYLEWTHYGFLLREDAKKAPSLCHCFRILPLRVIKQIVCMFFSTNGPLFREAFEELSYFVLNRDRKYIQPEIRIYIAFNLTNKLKQTGLTSRANLEPGINPVFFSEIAFPPWIYIMTTNSPPPDRRLVDITHFSRYNYNEWKDIPMKIPVLPIHTWLPADFRKKEDVLRDYLANKEYARQHPELNL